MPSGPMNRVMEGILRTTPADAESRGDGDLLGRFVERNDGAAFAAIMRRHAPMVWGVCLRALRNHQDAEDAFQATFLVLIRKAAAVSPRDMVGNWLYGVAFQAALQAKRAITRRRGREVQVMDMPETPITQPDVSADLQTVLDEELIHLPEIYRAVVVLCDLEGRSRKEVARQLGVPDGTVGGRLARARTLLAKRLAKRGVTLSAAALATTLSSGALSASVPSLVVSKTIRLTRIAAGPVASLAEGVVRSMFIAKLKTVSTMVILVLLGGAATLLTDPEAVGQDGGRPIAETRVQHPRSAVAAPVPRQKENEELTAWGKEAGGLQAGLGYKPREKRVHRPGETITLVVRVRNVGKEEVLFQHLRHFFIENPPTITDDKGKPVPFKDGSMRGIYKPVDENVAPGKEIDLYELSLTLSATPADPPQASTLYGEGKFQLQYERILGDSMLSSVSIKTDAELRKLATGKLDLFVSKWIHESGAGQKKEEPGKKLLQGEWAVTAWQEEGVDADAEDLKGKKVVIDGNVMSGVQPGISGSMSFKLNPEKTPNEIDLTVLDGERKGKTDLGIYQIEGNQLRICVGGKVRPTEFGTTPRSGRMLLTLEREPQTTRGKEAGGLKVGRVELEVATQPKIDKDLKSHLKRLKGRWTLFETFQVQANKKTPHDELRFDLAETSFRLLHADRPAESGAVEVDITKTPPILRLRFRKESGEFTGAELAGPMEFRSDDEWWFAIPDTSVRPTAEALLAGQPRVVWKLKRTPPPAPTSGDPR